MREFLIASRTFDGLIDIQARVITAPEDALADLVDGRTGKILDDLEVAAILRAVEKVDDVEEVSAPRLAVYPSARANLSVLRDLHRELAEEAKRRDWPEAVRVALEPVDELIAESQDGVDRTIAIVRDVREFARDGTGSPERVDLSDVVESALRVAAAAGPSRVEIDVDVEDGLEIEGLASRIRQVVLNLLLNALHAVGERGRVEVRASTVDAFARIEVRDDGAGIAPADLERVFEPFFTTKPAGEGTGLGLYISHEIVRWHSGRFEVRSSPGDGATFVVDLPLHGGAESRDGISEPT